MTAIEKACVVSIDGDFDLCQQIIKKAVNENKFLTCNSISLARLLPQIGYYAYLSKKIPNVNIIIPSGNLGNATSAYMAKMMGCTINNIIVACNENDAVTRFFNNIDINFIPKKTVQTLATAMDIGNPSNFVRLWFYMQYNKNNIKSYSVSNEMIIKFKTNKNCPHTTVGIVVASKLKNMINKCIVRTADQQKFSKNKINFIPHLKNVEKIFSNYNNIILIGMPGSGKSTVSRMFKSLDSDTEIENKYNLNLSHIVNSKYLMSLLI